MTAEERADEIARNCAIDYAHPAGYRTERDIAFRIAAAIREAVAEEREACARIADDFDPNEDGGYIAEEIRARGS